jgi:hypothetical protein
MADARFAEGGIVGPEGADPHETRHREKTRKDIGINVFMIESLVNDAGV